MKRAWPALIAAALLGVAPRAPYGILLLAHGGDSAWDAEISHLRESVNASVPAEAALGMAEQTKLQAALDRLVARGVGRVVVVPLFVQSRSEVMDQTRYVLGLSEKPSDVLRSAYQRMAALPAGAHRHSFSLERVKTRLPVVLSSALDDDPFVSRVLLERAKALSRDAKTESVVLVAHGPVDGAAIAAWEEALAVHARAVRAGGGFRAVSFALLRDDAEADIRAKAVEALRARVAAEAKGGRVLVVPVLIARGGIEAKIVRDLQGLDYAWNGETLMPHPGFADWVLSRAAKTAAER